MEKRLGATMIAGDGIVSIDNCEHALGGELLCQALTQQTLKIRILGKSVNAEVPSNAALFATGNNLTVTGDMTRRTLMGALDPECERPELRTFDSDPIEELRQNRGRYVVAALTVLRAYHLAGRPPQATPLGSFEAWSRWVRDALLWLGEADPCDTMERTRQEDLRLAELITILEQWGAVLGERRVSVKEVIEEATKTNSLDLNSKGFVHAEFREALLVVAGDGGAINSRRLGKWLAAKKGRIVGGARIVEGGKNGGSTVWQLRKKVPQ